MSGGSPTVRFYRRDEKSSLVRPEKPPGVEGEFWRPRGIAAVYPPGSVEIRWLVWRLADVTHVFRNRDYGVHVVSDGSGHPVHRACIFPAFFRFPFMAPHDIQIGDVWTDGPWRGRGIAAWSIGEIVRRYGCPGRAVWYLTEQANEASVRVIEGAGFGLQGIGGRIPVLGIGKLGQYRMTSRAEGT